MIGVVAIAAMGMMGANMTLMVKDQMSEMGNVLTVTPDAGTSSSFGGERIGRRPPGGGGSSTSSSSSDDDNYISASMFKEITNAVGKNGTVYALYTTSDSFTSGSKEGRTTVYGLDPDVIPDLMNLTDGAYPKGDSGALVGASLAERFNLTLGSKLKLGDDDEGYLTTRVTGIIEERGMSFDLSTDMAVILPEGSYTAYLRRRGALRPGQRRPRGRRRRRAPPRPRSRTDSTPRRLRSVSATRAGCSSSITSTVSTMTTFVMAIAGISLLVAAVSIFNVMMMSVTERVREIGIMRSLGTQKGEILKMFVYEATVLGIVGVGNRCDLQLRHRLPGRGDACSARPTTSSRWGA